MRYGLRESYAHDARDCLDIESQEIELAMHARQSIKMFIIEISR